MRTFLAFLPKPSRPLAPKERFKAQALAALYLTAITAVAYWGRPLSVWSLVGVGLAPAVVLMLAGLPRVVRCPTMKLAGIMAVMHLLMYPLMFTVAIGLPAALVTYALAESFTKWKLP